MQILNKRNNRRGGLCSSRFWRDYDGEMRAALKKEVLFLIHKMDFEPL